MNVRIRDIFAKLRGFGETILNKRGKNIQKWKENEVWLDDERGRGGQTTKQRQRTAARDVEKDRDKRKILKSVQPEANRVPRRERENTESNLIRYSQKLSHKNAIRHTN